MEECVIERASQLMDEDSFERLTNLNVRHEWLHDKAKALFALWGLGDTQEQKELIEFLIDKFVYINGRDLDNGCKLIAEQVECKWNLEPKNTIISAISKDTTPDGSQTIIQKIKNKFSSQWDEKMLCNSLPTAINRLKDGYNIVLVDDFIGTGDTMCSRVKFVKETSEKKGAQINIYIVSLAAMNFSKGTLDTLNISYYSVYWLLKGISEQKDDVREKEIAINAMKNLEAKLKDHFSYKDTSKKHSLPKFGYKQSEALFSIGDDNIPNNVFPIFWWPYLKNDTLRKTLFQRW